MARTRKASNPPPEEPSEPKELPKSKKGQKKGKTEKGKAPKAMNSAKVTLKKTTGLEDDTDGEKPEVGEAAKVNIR